MQNPELILTGPDSIVASIPYLLGFTPCDSLIVLWLNDGRLRLTMRLDLPPERVSSDEWVDAVLQQRAEHDEVILCVVPAQDDPTHDQEGELRSREFVTTVLERLAPSDCHVRDALLMSGDRWWSYLCSEPECCSSAGNPVDPAIAEATAARFVLAGVGRLSDRQSVIDICAAEPARQALTREHLAGFRQSRAQRLASAVDRQREFELWRDESIELVREVLLTSMPIDVDRAAETLWALGDVRVRDTAIWEIAHDAEHNAEHNAHRAFDMAAGLLRSAPGEVTAPIGTVTALLAWLIGDGVRAMAALDRVHVEEPGYALAELLRRSITAGLPPAGWLEMMRDLSRDACRGRHRDSAPAA